MALRLCSWRPVQSVQFLVRVHGANNGMGTFYIFLLTGFLGLVHVSASAGAFPKPEAMGSGLLLHFRGHDLLHTSVWRYKFGFS